MALELTDRQKVAHVLRRFGFGGTPEEIDEGARIGADAVFAKLLAPESVDEQFPVSPWEICHEEGKEEIYLDPFRVAAWWGLRMIMTKRPLQEKLSLFWHNHFAVSGTKVEFGPMMLDYLEAIRSNAFGDFSKLLGSMAANPAMMFWLDTMHNQKGAPNENFARELFELFTMGLGAYSEQDVKETARAFTGWGIRFLIYEQGGENAQDVAKECARSNRPMTTFSYSPGLHDDGEKTILGATKNWTGERVLEMLADRPETAKLLAKKLWSFFAYPDPEPVIVERLSSAYLKSGRGIRSVLRAIYNSPEFWSEKCLRRQIKCPIDFVIPILRQLGLGPFLLASHGPAMTPDKPLAKPLRDIGGAAVFLSNEQGMLLLYPPDVSGWNWGQAWISSDAMRRRLLMGDRLMGIDSKDYGGAVALGARVIAVGVPKSESELVDRFLIVFDAEISSAQRLLLIEAAQKNGGIGALAKPESAATMFASLCRLLFSSPEFQMC